MKTFRTPLGFMFYTQRSAKQIICFLLLKHFQATLKSQMGLVKYVSVNVRYLCESETSFDFFVTYGNKEIKIQRRFHIQRRFRESLMINSKELRSFLMINLLIIFDGEIFFDFVHL